MVEFGGEGAGFSRRDGVLFDLGDGHGAHEDVGEKDFAGGEEVVDGEEAFVGEDVDLGGAFEDDLAGDAGEAEARGGVRGEGGIFDGEGEGGRGEVAVLVDDEDVADGAFGEVVGMGGEPEGFAGAGGVGFAEGGKAFEVGGAFVAGDGAVEILFEAGVDDGHAGVVEGGGVGVEALGGEDEGDGRGGVFIGDGVGVAAGDGEAESGIAVHKVVGFKEFGGEVGELRFIEGEGDGEDVGGGGEAFEVLAGAEDFAIAGAEGFEESCAVEEAGVAGGDGGVIVGEELAVDMDVVIHKGER